MDLEKYQFTVSQQSIIKNIQSDLKMWNEKTIEEIFPFHLEEKYEQKIIKRDI